MSDVDVVWKQVKSNVLFNSELKAKLATLGTENWLPDAWHFVFFWFVETYAVVDVQRYEGEFIVNPVLFGHTLVNYEYRFPVSEVKDACIHRT